LDARQSPKQTLHCSQIHSCPQSDTENKGLSNDKKNAK
jgi:hypothetical protein